MAGLKVTNRAEMSSDEELMRAVQQGDLSAFEQIVSRHQTAAWSTACRFLNDPAEAQDRPSVRQRKVAA